MANLTSCKITFFTFDEDKDFNTSVAIRILDYVEKPIAELIDLRGHFPDQTMYGPYSLSIKKDADIGDINRGFLEIKINPTGDDTWHFSYELDLEFDDGSYFSGGDTEYVVMTEKESYFSCPLAGMLGLVKTPAVQITQNTIQLFTKEDDKDYDTWLMVRVRDQNNILVGYLQCSCGEFKSNTATGAMELSIRNQSSQEDLKTGKLSIYIFPNGDDSWSFTFFLVFSFSDGSILVGGVDSPYGLDEQLNGQTFDLRGMLKYSP